MRKINIDDRGKMKITHLCLGNFYIDNYSYQENLLSKYHKKLGNDVNIIASLQTFDENGNVDYFPSKKTYINEYGIPVLRLDYKKPLKIYQKLKRFQGTLLALEEANPEILFIHGCQFLDMDVVIKYLKGHPQTKVYVDNHADFSNSGRTWISLNILHKGLWKHSAKIVEPYVKKFYGVLPARVEFLKNIYKVPEEKVELLVMGADDEKVEDALDPMVRKEIRNKFQVKENDFLIMTGGKIDAAKKQTINLMKAINKLANPHVKLIVFGSIIPELKEEIEKQTSQYAQYIGWVESKNTTRYYAAADLVVFPGRHSVFWEQVVGLGKPMICKSWEGTKHVDLGGNVIFLNEGSTEEIYNVISNLLNNYSLYVKMKTIAEKDGMQIFSYENIAKRSIEG